MFQKLSPSLLHHFPAQVRPVFGNIVFREHLTPLQFMHLFVDVELG